jgi:hypothetical protein
MQAGSDWPHGRRTAAVPALEDAILPESGAAQRRFGSVPPIIRRVKRRIEHLEPPRHWLIATDRPNQQVAGARHRNIGDPDRLCSIPVQFLIGSLQEFDGRAAAERLQP